MARHCIRTPSGQVLLCDHIAVLDVQEMGQGSEFRAEVQATLSTGEKYLLRSFQGEGASGEAQAYLRALLERMEMQPVA